MKVLPRALLIGPVLALAWLVYQPGLSGDFLFDDHGNLPALGHFGPVDDFTTAIRYVTSGTADPTGRPISLASFLIDANNWPAEPASFKRTNLILHLFNGLLLAMLLLRLGNEQKLAPRHNHLAAVAGMALWLLHPFLVSTTLYIVQRHAMLPATFVLLGLLGYVGGRQRVLEDNSSTGASLMIASIGLGTCLATLCKANGALLPLLAGVLELTVFRAPTHKSTAFLAARHASVSLPCILIGAYLVARFPADLGESTSNREWTHGQRLMTEARVVVTYLYHLWIPKPYTAGLFNDHIIASEGWLKPVSTLLCAGTILLLIASALLLRLRHPAYSAALLFYFSGHLLESTFLPLELYFEHRNYLPSLLLFWPLTITLTRSGAYQPQRLILCATAVALVTGLTWLRSDLWGNRQDQALLWATLNPSSPRATTYAAHIEIQSGNADAAEFRLRHAINSHPNQPQLTIKLLSARCAQGGISERDLNLAKGSLEENLSGTGLLTSWFFEALEIVRKVECDGLTWDALSGLLDSAERNPQNRNFPDRLQGLLYLRSQMYLAQGNPDKALTLSNAALELAPRPSVALLQAAALGSSGYPCHGLAHLNTYDPKMMQDSPPVRLSMQYLHERILRTQGYWSQEFSVLRSTLMADAFAAHNNVCPTPKK